MKNGVLGVTGDGTCNPAIGVCDVGRTFTPTAIADTMMPYMNETNLSGVKAGLMALMNAPNEGFSSPIYYVGYDNENFFSVKECSWKIAACEQAPGWTSDMTYEYLGYVGNQALYGDLERRVYAMYSNGTVGVEIGKTPAYQPTV